MRLYIQAELSVFIHKQMGLSIARPRPRWYTGPVPENPNILYRIPLTHVQGKACGAKKQKFEAACGNFSFAAAEGGKGFREAFEQTVRSCSDGGIAYRPGHGSAGLDAQRANRSVQTRCFPAWRHLSEGVLSTIFVMHSAIWIFRGFLNKSNKVFVKIYTGPVGEHRDYGLYLRGCSDIINIGAVCIKDICKKLDKRLERGAGPPQRGRAA